MSPGRRSWTRLAAVIAAGSLAVLVAPGSAQAALKAIWGPSTLPDGSSAFPTYQRLGVDVFQEGIRWVDVASRRPADPRNPADPAYRWNPEIDEDIAQARVRGIEVALVVLWTPAWANGGRAENWAPLDPSDYADFIVAVSRRYPEVRRWMIWGEANGNGFLPMPKHSPEGPRRYARLLDAAYRALKAENPQNVVIGSMTFTSGLVEPHDFIRWLRLPSGRPPPMDLWGHNPFSRRYPRLSDPPSRHRPKVRDFSDLDTLYNEIRKAYRGSGPAPRLWLSEYMVQSDARSDSFVKFTTRAGQADWLRQSYRIADRNSWIEALGWVELLDVPVIPPLTLPINWGLMTREAVPKPAFQAYLDAPSRRFTPSVLVQRNASRSELATGLPVKIFPRRTGTIQVALLDRKGKRLALVKTAVTEGQLATVPLRAPSVTPGGHVIAVKAIRGERVELKLDVR